MSPHLILQSIVINKDKVVRAKAVKAYGGV